jgi:hypothetical protein
MKKAILFLMALAIIFSSALTAAVPVQAAAICGTPMVVDLLAGKTIPAGKVTIENDANNVYITLSTAGTGWFLSETHVHVGDSLASLPQTKTGNPKIGNFSYQTTHLPLVTEVTYTIAKSAWITDAFKNVTVAAHAVVVKVDGAGNIIASETGWGQGSPFNTRGSWATYINYTWQDCTQVVVETKTETAFAFGSTARCFDQFDVSNRWGWTNGPLSEGNYVFDLYAGAGQCDTNKGTKVGTLSVSYSNGIATVKYQMAGKNPVTGMNYTLTETHLYVGAEALPRDKQGEFTVAPGQYPYINPEINALSRTYTVEGLSGPINIVAHATVAGFPK